MPDALAQLAARDESRGERRGIDIVTGVVMSNLDLLAQGKLSVRVPSLGVEVTARVCAPGAGTDRGWQTPYQPNDEVLLAIVDGNPADAYILGGLWGTLDRPPNSNPAEQGHKTKFKTGLLPGTGHVMEFDDVLQQLEIVSSTGQKISMNPDALRLETTGGTLSIELNLLTQTISISSMAVVEIDAKLVKINGDLGVDISGGKTVVSGKTLCSVEGKLVKIN
jgi:phage baseplate assembly protein gpV